MPIKTALVATALALLPALSSAMCSDREHQAQSCAAGMVWDSAQQACVKQINS